MENFTRSLTNCWTCESANVDILRRHIDMNVTHNCEWYQQLLASPIHLQLNPNLFVVLSYTWTPRNSENSYQWRLHNLEDGRRLTTLDPVACIPRSNLSTLEDFHWRNHSPRPNNYHESTQGHLKNFKTTLHGDAPWWTKAGLASPKEATSHDWSFRQFFVAHQSPGEQHSQEI